MCAQCTMCCTIAAFCRTLTSAAALVVDKKVEAKPPPALLPPPLRGLPALSRRYLYHSASTSSLKYGDVQPSEFHSTAALAAWVAKWPAGQMEVDNIFTIGVRGPEVLGGSTQVNLSIRRPFLEKIDSSAPSRSWELQQHFEEPR